MRRRRRRAYDAKKSVFIVFFVLALILSTTYALLQQQINIFGTAKINLDIQDGPTYSGWGVVTAELQTTWTNQDGKMVYHYNIKIENTSSANIDGWEILINVPEDAGIHASGGGEYSFTNGILKIVNAEGEGVIAPGSSYATYIQLTTNETNHVITYLVLNGVRMNLTGETVEPTSININVSEIEILKGQKSHLTVFFEPYNAGGTVVWSTNDANIASVDSETGLITAVNGGTCIITATCGELSDTCTVIVLTADRESENLKVEFLPGNSWGAGTGYNVQYTLSLTNISDTAISGWSFDVVLPAGSSYAYGWNATTTNTEGTTYHIEGTQTLQPGGTNTEVGMTFIVPSSSYIPIPINIQP